MTLAILRMAGTHAVAWNLRAAAAIVASLPPLILFIVLQQYFVRGILGGAVIKK
jgi:alpha-glucoside transport system permease protein